MAITFLLGGTFRADLERRVDAYFTRSGLSRRDVPAMYLKTAVLFACLAGSYVGLVFLAHAWWSALPLAVVLGLSIAGIGFNVQHDGGHGAYSKRRAVNRLMAWALDVIGGSSYFWSFKHNIAHHTYPNVSGADDDIEVGRLGRMGPNERWYPLHRGQHIYMWFLYGLLTIRWQLIDDFHSMIDPGIGQTHVPRPRGWDLARFWAGKAIFAGLAFVLPAMVHPFWVVFLFYLAVQISAGLILGSVFQLAHCVEEARFPVPVAGRIQNEWAQHQLETTVDFGRGNRLLSWYVGGLNYQIEHHLFPQVCHLHYPALARIVEEAAHDHGLAYRSNETLRRAVASHYRWLYRMGRKPVAPPA